ncbi:aspartic proteinase NANA, chloroplast [Benincasa hispida]|uniref:aspartic proteinase NANA, chloroplast n=1 Tax=Benincasa hispida TaxID=102211 RepID=UPI00190262EB|nr:aspartic proteinase NANA, chloroplast [Benincasa hispida]
MLGYRKPMSPISHFCLFFLFFFLSVPIAFGDGSHDQENVKLDLLHRHHPQVSEKLHGDIKLENMNDRIKDILEHDQKRYQTISSSLNRNELDEQLRKEAAELAEKDLKLPPISSTPIGLKMISGSDYGSSEYFVQLKVGTPPQTFMLIADTGSDLTWMKCRYRRCIGNCSSNPNHKTRNERKVRFRNAFLANYSSSFKTIDCSSKMCTNDLADLFSIGECQTPTSPCLYDYSYSGGASAKGLFAIETLTVGLTNGKEKQLHNSIIGCTESVQGRIFGGADGVIGLGTSSYSFTYKAAENANGGGFAYCLVDHLSDRTATSYFILGNPISSTDSAAAASSVAPTGNMSFTKLFLGDPYSSFYGVDLVGISADGVMLNIPPRVWDINSGGGTIVDSGTSLTMLAAPAFDMVMEALVPKLKHFENIEIEPFDFCFNNSRYTHEMAPKLRFHFGDGTVFQPPPKSYIVSVGEYISCIGFVSMPFPATNIIGNILQQNHLWKFDFHAGTVGFAPSECV